MSITINAYQNELNEFYNKHNILKNKEYTIDELNEKLGITKYNGAADIIAHGLVKFYDFICSKLKRQPIVKDNKKLTLKIEDNTIFISKK